MAVPNFKRLVSTNDPAMDQPAHLIPGQVRHHDSVLFNCFNLHVATWSGLVGQFLLLPTAPITLSPSQQKLVFHFAAA